MLYILYISYTLHSPHHDSAFMQCTSDEFVFPCFISFFPRLGVQLQFTLSFFPSFPLSLFSCLAALTPPQSTLYCIHTSPQSGPYYTKRYSTTLEMEV